MKREDLIVYTKDEADAVMDAMEQRIKELEATISEMETAAPKWISVKDRLPEDLDEVIVYDDGSIYVAEFDDYDGDKRWVTSWFSSSIDETHWQPLPPPPTTEEK